jgi:hypothetical protein
MRRARAAKRKRSWSRAAGFPISRPRIARQAALLLVRHDRKELALDLLSKVPGNDPEVALTRAIVLALMDRNDDDDKLVKQIESQWPEWDRPYLVHGLLLERSQPREAMRKLQTAVALGSKDLALRCAVARLTPSASADPQCSCVSGLYGLFFPRCAQP